MVSLGTGLDPPVGHYRRRSISRPSTTSLVASSREASGTEGRYRRANGASALVDELEPGSCVGLGTADDLPPPLVGRVEEADSTHPDDDLAMSVDDGRDLATFDGVDPRIEISPEPLGQVEGHSKGVPERFLCRG